LGPVSGKSSTNQPEVGILDPRTRILITLLFVLWINMIPPAQWWLYGVALMVVWAFVLASGAPLMKIWLRTLATLPFLLAALAIPFTTPGPVVWTVPGVGWQLTRSGLELFGSVLARFLLAVQATVTLASVTPAHELFQALGRIGVPAALVAIIGLMYRYLTVLGDDAARMLRARAARSSRAPGGRRPSLLWHTRVTGSMIGSLFVRAVARGDRLHMAMRSRGFDGTVQTLNKSRLHSSDWIVLSIAVAATLGLLYWRFA
jgi:cobalt/nickel transport system permease protein